MSEQQAKILAHDVLPVPRGPANRKACDILPRLIAFFNVSVIAVCPTTPSKVRGRHLRYSA